MMLGYVGAHTENLAMAVIVSKVFKIKFKRAIFLISIIQNTIQ